MNKEQIFELLKKNLQTVLPDVEEEHIEAEFSMVDLGANSMDRSEVLIMMLSDLSLQVPLVDFSGVDTIGGLVDRLHSKLTA